MKLRRDDWWILVVVTNLIPAVRFLPWPWNAGVAAIGLLFIGFAAGVIVSRGR